MNREDIERLSNLEVEIVNVKEKLDEHCKSQRIDFDKVFQKLDNLENRFAGKWVEKVAVALVVGGLIALITFIIQNV